MEVMKDDPLLERAQIPTGYRLTTVSQAFDLVRGGEDPWIALGDFLDDWRRAETDQRPLLVFDPIRIKADEANRRWAALFAAVADWLCWTSEPRIEAPVWTNEAVFDLPEPWFVIPGEAMRSWQLVESPAPFRMRRIFTDASIVARA